MRYNKEKTKINMRSFYLKISAILIGCFIITYGAFDLVMQGGLFVNKISSTPSRSRLVAETNVEFPNVNLQAKDFSVKSTSEDGVFRKSKPINVSCKIENNSDKNARNFKALIRTPKVEIKSKYFDVLKPQKQILLEGSFTPENTGVTLVACRADSGFELKEANENDNREIVAVYVRE